jgi:hypothetical protein
MAPDCIHHNYVPTYKTGIGPEELVKLCYHEMDKNRTSFKKVPGAILLFWKENQEITAECLIAAAVNAEITTISYAVVITALGIMQSSLFREDDPTMPLNEYLDAVAITRFKDELSFIHE